MAKKEDNAKSMLVDAKKHPNLWKMTAGVVPTENDSPQHRAAALYGQLTGNFEGDRLILASRWGVGTDGNRHNFVAVDADLLMSLNDDERLIVNDVTDGMSAPNIAAGLVKDVILVPVHAPSFDVRRWDPNPDDSL